jgi:cyanophycinase-like exopeptidase
VKTLILFFTSVLLLSAGMRSQTISQGNLVIVGGGLEDTNKSIYSDLIGLAGGAEKAIFSVIPTASSVPAQSFASFRSILIS